jgi:uncharacterized protein YcnI
MPSIRRFIAVAAAAGAAAALVVVTALPASAHVTVDPSDAAAGGFTVITFKVPNERDDAATTKLEMQLPPDHPMASVSVRPVGAWKATTTTTKLPEPLTDDDGNQITDAVSTVTWEGGRIDPGQFEEFRLQVGPLPDGAGTTMAFPAVQTYDNGDVVRWIDPTVAGQPEPEHPAPSLVLTAADAGGAASAAVPSSSSSSDGTGRALGIIGIAVGAVGLVIAVVALAATRRRPSPPPT